MEKLMIIGTSTTAKVIYSFVQKYGLYEVLGFAVNEKYKKQDTYCGLPVFSIEDLDSIIDKEKDYLFVAIQWNNLNADRKKVYKALKAQGYRFANLISPMSIVNGTIDGDNCWITDSAIIDFGATIQSNTFIMVGAMVGPNTKVMEHCFIGSHSIIGGGAIIGKQCFIGLGAIVFDEVHVGERSIVGAATALKRNLPEYSVIKVKGDNYIIKQYTKDVIESKLQFAKNIRKVN